MLPEETKAEIQRLTNDIYNPIKRFIEKINDYMTNEVIVRNSIAKSGAKDIYVPEQSRSERLQYIDFEVNGGKMSASLETLNDIYYKAIARIPKK